MKCQLLKLAAALYAAGAAGAKTHEPVDQGHPVKNVIVMLKNQAVQIDEEGRTELKTYNKFKAWCDKSTKSLNEDIESERALISKTKNQAFGKDKNMEELGKQISSLDAEIKRQQESIQSTNDQRTEQADAFAKADEDFKMTLDALTQAIDSLKASSADATATSDAEVASAAGLLQLPLVLGELSENQISLLEGKPPKDMMETRDYSFKSGDIVNLLMDLKQDFTKKQKEASKVESEAITEHGFVVEDLDKALKASEASKKEKESVLADVKGEHAELKTKLESTEKAREENMKLLDDTNKDCNLKASEWSERKEKRYNEVKAIKAAIEVLDKVTGVRTEVPTTQAAGLLASGSKVQPRSTDPVSVAVQLLRERARQGRADSAALEGFASKIETEPETAKTGKDLSMSIEKQIWALKSEQEKEDKKHLWCETQIDKSNTSFIDKTELLNKTAAKLLEKEAKIQELKEEISAAETKVSELKKSMEEATEIRKTNKEENMAAIKDAKAAQEAVAKAIGVLSAFYEGVGGSAFLQTGSKDAPDTWSGSYSGVADPNADGGVLGLLNTVAEDMAAMEIDTKSQESADEAAYEEEMKDSKKEEAAAKTEIELKTEEKTRQEKESRNFRRTKAMTDRELETIKNFLSDLSYSCSQKAYTERKEARTQEITDLEDAQTAIEKAFGVNTGSVFLAPVSPTVH
eukprot:gb/GFBE01075170.1/.p1 GENE.gb/GFBE01075170.1/~~gb/GFBE01075170.1/.p1  ORF type:complete len:693 (+),score=288.54 gb/GFBE01075170.1/:1-2079(+)